MKVGNGVLWERQRGLSLIELMISLVIGLLLMAAVVQMFVGSRVTFSMQNELAKLQENARFAMNFISQDLRMAGYIGCNKHLTVANTLRDTANSDALYDAYDLSVPFTIEDNYDSESGTDIALPTSASPTDDTDIVSIKFADSEGGCAVTDHNTSSAVMTCSGHNFVKGQVVLVSDCKKAAILQHVGGNPGKIDHNTGNSVTPGNCTKGLGLPTECTTNGAEEEFTGGTVMFLRNYTYYIDQNDFNVPALYRSTVGVVSNGATLGRQELVEGVENMQVWLGFDTNDDGVADRFTSSVDTSGATSETIENVVAVRVSFVMRSITNNITSSPQSYVLNGDTINPTDNYLRKVFTSTIMLRNRVL